MQILIKRGSPEEIAEFFRKNRWLIARLLGNVVHHHHFADDASDDVADYSPASDNSPEAIEEQLEETLEEIEDIIDDMCAEPSDNAEVQELVEEIKETIDDIQDDLGYENADDQEDDLSEINGLGPKTAQGLKAAGIHSFKQLAALTDDDVAALDRQIKNFAKTFVRKDYRGQANDLL